MQISHHPPVAALHATDEKENIEMIWCQRPDPKFNGISLYSSFSRLLSISKINFQMFAQKKVSSTCGWCCKDL